MLYFAYGCRTKPERMLEECPNAKPVGIHKIDGFRLVFEGTASGYGYKGVANIKRDPNSSVWGVMWEVSEDELLALDADEGVGSEYDIEIHSDYERVYFKLPDGRPFFLYYLVHPHVPNRPSMEYYMDILDGYEHFGIDTTQVKQAYRATMRKHH